MYKSERTNKSIQVEENMIKIQHFITEEHKEIFNDLTDQLVKKIDIYFENNPSAIENYTKQGIHPVWVDKIIIIPSETHSLKTVFTNTKIFQDSFSFQGYGDIKIFNYLNETGFDFHKTGFDFYFKISKTSVSYTVRARNFPGLNYKIWKDKLKDLPFKQKVDAFFLLAERIKKLNETKFHETQS